MSESSLRSVGWRRLVAVSSAVVILMLSVFWLRGNEKPVDPQEWSKTGNFIVAYGPVFEPYPAWVKNSYYVYSPSGELIDHKVEDGGWWPVSLPTKGGAYLYFAHSLQQVGVNRATYEHVKYDYTDVYGSSPDGSYAVALLNTSHSGECSYTAAILKDTGQTFSHDLPFMPFRVAVGEDHAIAVGYDCPPPGTETKKGFYLLEPDGSGKELKLPQGYDIGLVDFPASPVNYLGDGLFEIIEGRKDGNVIHMKSFEVRVDSQEAALVTERVTEHKFTLPDDFLVTVMLNHGEGAFIDKSGRVFIDRRDLSEPEYMGQVENFERNDFVPTYTVGDDPKFGIKRDGRLELYRWESPDQPILTVNQVRGACWEDVCDLASVSEIM